MWLGVLGGIGKSAGGCSGVRWGCLGGCSWGALEDVQGHGLKVLRDAPGCSGEVWERFGGCSEGAPGCDPKGAPWGGPWALLGVFRGCSEDAQGVLRALGPSCGCPGAASAADHSGQECFQSSPGSGMEARSVAGQLGEGRKAPSPGGTPRGHRVRAGRGPQALGSAVEVPRVVFSLKAKTIKPCPAMKMWLGQAPG